MVKQRAKPRASKRPKRLSPRKRRPRKQQPRPEAIFLTEEHRQSYLRNQPTNPDGFEPTLKQYSFALNYAATYGNITQAAKESRIDRSVIYDWQHTPGFSIWLSEFGKTEVRKREGKWWLIAERYAEAGSLGHLQLLLQLADKWHPRVDIYHSLSDEKLIELAGKKRVGLDNRLSRYAQYSLN